MDASQMKCPHRPGYNVFRQPVSAVMRDLQKSSDSQLVIWRSPWQFGIEGQLFLKPEY